MFDQLGLGNLLGTNAFNNYNQMSNQLASLGQSNLLNQQYNQMMQKPKWVFDGRTCTVREMADSIWPTDCPEKTHFLLKWE